MPFGVKSYGEPPPYDEVAEYDSGREIYHGWATPGTATSRARWMILKTSYTLNAVTGVYEATSWRWADGNRDPDKIWDNRGDYEYI